MLLVCLPLGLGMDKLASAYDTRIEHCHSLIDQFLPIIAVVN